MVIVRIADAGDLYVSWHWMDGSGGGVEVITERRFVDVLADLAAALPDTQAIMCSLTEGAFAKHRTEHALAQRLSVALLPERLVAEIRGRTTRPHVRIQPSPRVAQVPWELLAVDGDVRLVEIADVSLLAPASIVHAAGRVAKSFADTESLPVVRILDPRVPGFAANSQLGSVLGRVSADQPMATRFALGDFRRTDVDRDWLSRELRSGASRLVYVGHVTAAAPESGLSENAQLHLACSADAVGFAPTMRDHRPLSAKDLLLGTHTLTTDPVAGSDVWPMPSRVALIACESGGDMRFGEALGLVAAMIHGGAELVTASRWALPTDAAYAAVGSSARPLQDAVCAIDDAHQSTDPVRAINDWQRRHLDDWRTDGAIEHSPLLWSSFATVDAVAPPPVRVGRSLVG